MKKFTTEYFIYRSNIIHNFKYDYSLSIYTRAKDLIKIICHEKFATGEEHGVFEQAPDKHLHGQKCPYCIGRYKTTKVFIAEANLVHNNEYDYSKTIYEFRNKEVAIICHKEDDGGVEHGLFFQVAGHHLRGSGCPKCFGTKKKTLDQFIGEANHVHGIDMYDYSLVNYERAHSYIEIKCNTCGYVFLQTPHAHINQKQGCPHCNFSHGELAVEKWLKKYNIKFEDQKTFENCKYKKKGNLEFDFYLSDFNMCIEYDGEQHFKEGRFFATNKNLKEIKIRDQIKNDYCFQNGIRLLRIPYWDFNNIEKILEKNLLEIKI